MLTLTRPLIYTEKTLENPPGIEEFLSSLRDIVLPVITAKNIGELLQQISKATPIYIALRESFIDTFKEGISAHADTASELSPSFIGRILKKQEKEKLAEALHGFISAARNILKAIEQTPSERSSHLINSTSGHTLLGKMIYTEFIFQCCRECLIDETAVAPQLFQWLIDAFYIASKEIQEYVDSILQAWDVLTDIIGMEAIKKSHEARKLTGKPIAGSKTVQEFLHELDFMIYQKIYRGPFIWSRH